MRINKDGTIQTLSFAVYGISSHAALCVGMCLAKTVLEDEILTPIKTSVKFAFM
jgi:hypothetical protein